VITVSTSRRTLQSPERVTDAGFAVSGMKGLSRLFRALVESKMACGGGCRQSRYLTACHSHSESLTRVLPVLTSGLSRPFRALVEPCGACDGAGQLQMPIPDPRCDRTERFRCRRYNYSLAGLSDFLARDFRLPPESRRNLHRLGTSALCQKAPLEICISRHRRD